MSKPIIAEYIWLSGANSYHDIRSKCKTLYIPIESPLSAYPEWNFDGSSTGQSGGLDTEILIRPVAKYPHPFIKNLPAVVILAECFLPDGTPTPDNSRAVAREIFDQKLDAEPWFGQEQEYVLYKDGRPFQWPEKGFPSPQGPYYCANGIPAWGRDIAMEHYEMCLNMGLRLSGLNAEVMPSQWEFQVGPCVGIEGGDHMTVARWVYLRVGEKYGVEVNFDCKPVQGDWNGSGCHTNFSTKEMRAAGGITKIYEAIKNLEKTREEDIMFYGTSNNRRLTGKHETSKLSDFTFGVGTRHTSIRIPNETNKNKCGYFEDRRPASDIDPYLVTSRVFASSLAITNNGLDPVKLKQRRTWMTRVNEKAATAATTRQH
jgi:glutamine synthetase